MPRVLAALAALGLSVAFLASPATGDARQKPKPSPRPTASASAAPSASVAPSPTATPAPTLTPSPASLDGIDVSYHQGAIDWTRVAGAGKRFAYVRASAGTLTADSAYATNTAGARAAGLTVGSYHFANPDSAANDASNEAAWFLRNAGIASGDLLPILDLEVANGFDPSSLIAWAGAWLQGVESATGVRPIIYTTPAFWTASMANTDWFAQNGYRLWIAHWTTALQPTVPAGNWAGQGWTFWQHSSTGSVPGIAGSVDLDRFNGASLTSAVLVP
ncbi:MAG TPA: GH25 family lysozyme [Candidatus Limnocylindrales bacterium]|nr:GH25 family lysozyme [Candidatus Limnocylindrales bacterium]